MLSDAGSLHILTKNVHDWLVRVSLFLRAERDTDPLLPVNF